MSIIALPSGATYESKRLTVRALKEAVKIVEAIQSKPEKQSDTIELVEKALALVIDSTTVVDEVDLNEAMILIGQAISGGRVTDDERKKSE